MADITTFFEEKENFLVWLSEKPIQHKHTKNLVHDKFLQIALSNHIGGYYISNYDLDMQFIYWSFIVPD